MTETIKIDDIVKLLMGARKTQDETKFKEVWDKLSELRMQNCSVVNVGRSKDITDAARKIVNGKFVVRLYDGFDNEWMDVSKPVDYEEALKIWNEKTEGGTKKIKFDDIDYYAIYLEDIVMRYSLEGRKMRK